MKRFDRRERAFAACLSMLAGFVDAIGFLNLGGFFVSFMSGNSTRMSVGIVTGSPDAAIAAALIGLFVVGVIAGSLIGHAAAGRRRTWVLLLVATLLAIGALAAGPGISLVAIVAIVLAMGAENAVFEQDGDIPIGVTYMTGTLVKFAQRVALALRGGERLDWVPYLLLWAGLVTGAVLGAVAYGWIAMGALWIASAAATVLALIARRT